jgi:hypothetical protein
MKAEIQLVWKQSQNARPGFTPGGTSITEPTHPLIQWIQADSLVVSREPTIIDSTRYMKAAVLLHRLEVINSKGFISYCELRSKYTQGRNV